jgi:hypothetical protein
MTRPTDQCTLNFMPYCIFKIPKCLFQRQRSGESLFRARNYEDPISTNKLSMVVCICHPSYAGGISKGLRSRPSQAKKHQTLLEKQLKYKGLGLWLNCWSAYLASGRTSVQSSVLHTYKKKVSVEGGQTFIFYCRHQLY